MSAPKKTLSEANRRMVELIVWGQVPSAIEALLATRSTVMKRADATRQASRIWRSVPAQRYAEELRHKLVAQRQRKLAGEQDRVRDRLWREATPLGEVVEELSGTGVKPVLGLGAKGSDRLVALTRLGQTSAMFKEKLVIEEPEKEGAELDDEIMGLLFPERTRGSAPRDGSDDEEIENALDDKPDTLH